MGDIATYHGDIGRGGLNPDFSFSGALGIWRRYVMLPASAMVRAAPLYLDRFLFTTGPHAGETHDVVIVAATDNTVAAYAEDQILAGGLVNALWIQQTLGPASQRGGSNIHPLIGISG